MLIIVTEMELANPLENANVILDGPEPPATQKSRLTLARELAVVLTEFAELVNVFATQDSQAKLAMRS